MKTTNAILVSVSLSIYSLFCLIAIPFLKMFFDGGSMDAGLAYVLYNIYLPIFIVEAILNVSLIICAILLLIYKDNKTARITTILFSVLMFLRVVTLALCYPSLYLVPLTLAQFAVGYEFIVFFVTILFYILHFIFMRLKIRGQKEVVA